MIIENRFYIATLNPSRGGSISYLRNKKAERSLVFREGCEIWCPKWGGFSANHYQQERVRSTKITVQKETTTTKVKVKSKLGNASNARIIRGWCVNNWVFKNDTPLIYCNSQIGAKDAEQAKGAYPNLFKKYICFYPGNYRHWAYREGDEVISGLLGWNNLTSHFKKGGTGYYLTPNRGWITLFNKDRGFALISLKRTKTCEDLTLWQSKSKAERHSLRD
ncbi:unnamed protein product, partial [marine sediment metagenome]